MNVRRRYPPELTSARRARDFVAQLLGGDPLETLEARLVTSELVTNAVLHGQTEIELSVWTTADRAVRIEVSDGGSSFDSSARRQPAEGDLRGRGLFLVDRLAERWGVEPKTRGKVVWATLAPAAYAV
jgi:anti-sigma regulatory factor (Ser/Thr protein kinase)